MTTDLNRCFMRFEDRAERITAEQIASTFVSVGPIMDVLSSRNHQVIYGRRGTGKTHALRYLQSSKQTAGDLAIYIDAQNIGSNGSIYNDGNLPIGERATRLLIDFCSEIHEAILEKVTEPETIWDLSTVTPILDGFLESLLETRVVGTVEMQEEATQARTNSDGANISIGLNGSPSSEIGAKTEQSQSSGQRTFGKVSGSEESWIDFSFFSRQIRQLAAALSPSRVWILVDEWSTVPGELQPHPADMLRRAFFNVPNVSLKIAAIEHRATFKISKSDGGYIGVELGADINAAVNLDDYLVVENNEDRAVTFFRDFVYNHAIATASDIGLELPSEQDFIAKAFTQENVFLEFVRASEGVPRDAMHIISQAAQKSNDSVITMPKLRAAAGSFFQVEKYRTVQENPQNRIMLDWIRDEVIGGRQTRAFLLPIGEDDPIIDRLFDLRALHILNRSRSAAHRPGERFIVYKLDYGLYVDLVNTEKFPQGLFVTNEGDKDIDFDVPADDARSYRRAILDLSRFYSRHPEITEN